jgi:hypothetical protein
MYACEIQIYCYSNVKYSTRIKFHVYHVQYNVSCLNVFVMLF